MELKAFVEKCRDEGQFTEIFNSGNHKSFCVCGGATDKDVAILLSHDYDRKVANDQFEADIERTWTVRKEKNPFLFNGSKFRLHAVDHEEEGKPLTLLLGQTYYKDYVCTNMNNDHWRFLSDYGKREYANEHACFSDALGVGSVVETSDNKLVFIRRSHQVYEDPGRLDTPGGHAEPSVSSVPFMHVNPSDTPPCPTSPTRPISPANGHKFLVFADNLTHHWKQSQDSFGSIPIPPGILKNKLHCFTSRRKSL